MHFNEDIIKEKMKKILVVILPEKNSSVKKYSGYYLPSIVKKPFEVSEHYTDIPIKYENLVIKNGVVEHTFSIYRDYASDNIYYLFQNHPLSFQPSYYIYENQNTGLYYNSNMIIFEFLYSIVNELVKIIESEKFTSIYILRFKMIPDRKNFFKYVTTSDLLPIIPKKVGFFDGEPTTTNILIDNSIHSVNLLLFTKLKQSKALFDFYFSYLNIFNYINGYPVQVTTPDVFLDKLFNEVRKIFIPENIESMLTPQTENEDKSENRSSKILNSIDNIFNLSDGEG